ncbi:MAG: glutamine amidotransferase, partial [Calditrichales bacterium]
GSTYLQISKQFADYEDWIMDSITPEINEWEVYDAHQSVPPKNILHYAGAIITGSHEMITEQSDWMIRTIRLVREFVDLKIPLLGICFGHQMLAVATGGTVRNNPLGLEIGNATIHQTVDGQSDPLFATLPASFSVYQSHYQSVINPPPGAILLAENEHDRCQAFRVGQCAWGIQFHPEFNVDIMKVCLQITSNADPKTGSDLKVLSETVVPTPWARQLFSNFASFVNNK